MGRYIIQDEDVDHCEYEYLIVSNGVECPNKGTKVVIDTDYPPEFAAHIGHYCDEHIADGFKGLNDA